MNLNQTIAHSPNVISQEVSGETVLLDLDSEHYFGLDSVGTRIWQFGLRVLFFGVLLFAT